MRQPYKRTSVWFIMDSQVNPMGPVEKNHPGEIGKLKYRELPIPESTDEEEDKP